jgi:hypothetical protein
LACDRRSEAGKSRIFCTSDLPNGSARQTKMNGSQMQKNISQNKDVMVIGDKHIATGRASVQHGLESRN